MDPNIDGAEALLGRIIGGYRLERVLGAGPMSIIYLGQQESSPYGQAAMKLLILPPQLSAKDRDKFHKRFQREALVLQRLNHPNILPIQGFGDEAGFSYIVQRYFPGGTLAEYLQQHPQLPLDQAAHYLTALASALQYAHSQKIIHRDIKPTNILRDATGQVFLADFGIVQLFEETETKLTSTGQILGTYDYMAPEQALNSTVEKTADIYSLGVVLYQMVTGRLPFVGKGPFELMMQHTQKLPPLPRQFRPELPEAAEAAILCALAKNPKDRFDNAEVLAQAFSQGLRQQGTWKLPPEWADASTVFSPQPTQSAAQPMEEVSDQETTAAFTEESTAATVLAPSLTPPEGMGSPSTSQNTDAGGFAAVAPPPIPPVSSAVKPPPLFAPPVAVPPPVRPVVPAPHPTGGPGRSRLLWTSLLVALFTIIVLASVAVALANFAPKNSTTGSPDGNTQSSQGSEPTATEVPTATETLVITATQPAQSMPVPCPANADNSWASNQLNAQVTRIGTPPQYADDLCAFTSPDAPARNMTCAVNFMCEFTGPDTDHYVYVEVGHNQTISVFVITARYVPAYYPSDDVHDPCKFALNKVEPTVQSQGYNAKYIQVTTDDPSSCPGVASSSLP